MMGVIGEFNFRINDTVFFVDNVSRTYNNNEILNIKGVLEGTLKAVTITEGNILCTIVTNKGLSVDLKYWQLFGNERDCKLYILSNVFNKLEIYNDDEFRYLIGKLKSINLQKYQQSKDT